MVIQGSAVQNTNILKSEWSSEFTFCQAASWSTFLKDFFADEIYVNMFISQYNLYNMSLISALINGFKMLILK